VDFILLLKWTKSFVFQFFTKHVLEIHCGGLPHQEDHFTLLATNHSNLQFPSWPLICNMLKNVLHSQSSPDNDDFKRNLNKGIARFQVEILQPFKFVPQDKVVRCLWNSINAFKLKAPATLNAHAEDTFPGTLHCEAVLTTISQYSMHAQAVLDNDRILSLIIEVLQVVLPTFSHN
jgi:hypothetical protein